MFSSLEKLKESTLETKYPCDLCDYSATRISTLRTHKSNKHEKYSCDKCEFAAATTKLLRIHVLENHKEVINPVKEYSCNLCNYVTKGLLKLNLHKHAEHMVPLPKRRSRVFMVPSCIQSPESSLFSLPKEPRTQKRWLKALKINHQVNTNTFRVCELHFKKGDIERDLKGELMNIPSRKKLNPYVVPSLDTKDISLKSSSLQIRERKKIVNELLRLSEDHAEKKVEEDDIDDPISEIVEKDPLEVTERTIKREEFLELSLVKLEHEDQNADNDYDDSYLKREDPLGESGSELLVKHEDIKIEFGHV